MSLPGAHSRKPIEVKRGLAVVRIYPRPAERGRQPRFMLADYSSGKRKWQTFSKLSEARAEATRLAALAAAGDTTGAGMNGDDRRDLTRATEIVAPFGLDVPTVCALFAEAAALVGPHYVVEACREYSKRAPVSKERYPIEKAADDYFAAKEARGRSTRLLEDIRSRIGRFAKDHPGHAVQDFTTAGIQSWLDRLRQRNGKPVSPTTRKNFAVVVGGLFEWARKRGVIRDNPCRDLERDGGKKSEGVEFWTPEEAHKLLAAAGDIVKPAVVIGLFCGLRTAELCRIKWRHVNLEAGHVEVGSDIAKTASRRLVPIPPSAQAWLKAHRGKPEAPIYPEHSTTLPKRISEACEAAGIRRIPNGMRHSWVTYRVAVTGDVSRTALEAGNSAAVIHQHYRGLATKDQGEAYFFGYCSSADRQRWIAQPI